MFHSGKRHSVLQRCCRPAAAAWCPRLTSFYGQFQKSLKCVFLYNGNLYVSVPLGHSKTLEEKYDEIKFVLEKISYRQHQ